MTNTPMEKIKAYQNIKTFLTKEQRTEVATLLNLTEEDLGRRLDGKEAEYNFLLRCYLLGHIEDIVAFEEGVSRLTNTVTTDFLFITKGGRRLAIEVKSTDKETWKISQKVFQQKRQFADLLNAELYFAIRINGYWLLISGTVVQNKSYKIRFEQYVESEFHILGEKSFNIESGITITSVYNQNPHNTIGIQHPDFGYLEKYKISKGTTELFKITYSTRDKLFLSFIFEALHDAASTQHQEIHSLGQERTTIIEKLTANTLISLSLFLIAPIKHILTDLNYTHDFATYVTEIVDKKDNYSITEDHTMYALGLLSNAGVEIQEIRGLDIFDFNMLYDFSNIK